MNQTNDPQSSTRNAEGIFPDQVDLALLTFSAKIDYLKIETLGKITLPPLEGKARWSRKEHYKSLTIHDATPCDVEALIACMGDVKILEIEVAVDVRPRPGAADKGALIERFMIDVTAMKLNPCEKTGIHKPFRVFYRHLGASGRVGPFNRRLPMPTDQQLHGGRYDASQVKAYYKRTDMGQDLESDDHVARTEVRLQTSALRDRGLENLTDLFTFAFRKELRPFFTHMRGVRRRKSSLRERKLGLYGIPLDQSAAKDDAREFRKLGVGAYLKGGTRESANVVFLRDREINNRIGQALMRLEKSFAENGFVRFRMGTA